MSRYESLGLNEEDAYLFHIEMWIYVHGIATMLATSYLEWDKMFISKVITDGFECKRTFNYIDLSTFGEAFFNDSFHNRIPHEELLRGIQCRTIFMKAKTDSTEDGILMAGLSEDDLERVKGLIADCRIVRFDCGHGISLR